MTFSEKNEEFNERTMPAIRQAVAEHKKRVEDAPPLTEEKARWNVAQTAAHFAMEGMILSYHHQEALVKLSMKLITKEQYFEMVNIKDLLPPSVNIKDLL